MLDDDPSRIRITLRPDRRRAGLLELFSRCGDTLLRCDCRGFADADTAAGQGNPECDPLLPFGHTPTGKYCPASAERVQGVACGSPGDRIIPLVGQEGDALEARACGRNGLRIQAGGGDGILKPTHGGIRLRQSDFDRLVRLMGGLMVAVDIRECD